MRELVDGFPALTAIFCASENWTIGDKGKIPWKCPADMKHFRETTIDNIVIMGAITWASLSSRLMKRHNIVLARKRVSIGAGVLWVRNVAELLEYLKNEKWKDKEAFLIGGAQTFHYLWDRVDRAIVTRINANVDGSAKFDERLLDKFIVTKTYELDLNVMVYEYEREKI